MATPKGSTRGSGRLLSDARNQPQGSRYIDPRTGRYVFDAFGRVQGQDNTQHLVLMAMLTVKGSSAQSELGVERPSGVLGRNWQTKRETALRSALEPLVKAGRIEIVSIEVKADQHPILTLVRWRDLNSGTETTTSI